MTPPAKQTYEKKARELARRVTSFPEAEHRAFELILTALGSAERAGMEKAAKIAEAIEQRVDHFYSPHLVCKAIADEIRRFSDAR